MRGLELRQNPGPGVYTTHSNRKKNWRLKSVIKRHHPPQIVGGSRGIGSHNTKWQLLTSWVHPGLVQHQAPLPPCSRLNGALLICLDDGGCVDVTATSAVNDIQDLKKENDGKLEGGGDGGGGGVCQASGSWVFIQTSKVSAMSLSLTGCSVQEEINTITADLSSTHDSLPCSML